MYLSALLLCAGLSAGATPVSVPGRVVTTATSPDNEKVRVKSLNRWYREADHWALKAIVLISYGPRWHPAGAETFLAALRDKDERLQAYALEGLVATDADALAMSLSGELVDQLVRKTLREKTPLFHKQTLALLARAFPEVGGKEKKDWSAWWREAKKTYAPAEWVSVEAGPEAEGRTSATRLVERAFDLYSAGMELALVIDCTGSMQPTIDASRAALTDIAEMLAGIAPKFRVGIVEYRDHGDMSDGARVVFELGKSVEKARKRLATLSAGGGGDMPECVDCGLEVALSKEMGWTRPANKMIVLIGDAPPHPRDRQRAVELARQAHESPFGVKDSEITERHEKGRSSTKKAVRPFIISAIGVGGATVRGPTQKAFREISEAGGGTYGELILGGKQAGDASRGIVEHVLTLAFGQQWAAQMERFVDIYLGYTAAGFF